VKKSIPTMLDGFPQGREYRVVQGTPSLDIKQRDAFLVAILSMKQMSTGEGLA